MRATPPKWAEALLRASLAPGDFETVSGDLLEEFRDRVGPARGRRDANVWYVAQVLGFVLRSARPWAVLFGGAVLTRTALDWFVPPSDFHIRATVSTALGVGILLAAGLGASWRSRSLAAGTSAGGATAVFGAAISITGAAALLAIRHDEQTMAAIHGSGGLGEVFVLPVMMILPGVLLGMVGGVVGGTVSKCLKRST